MLQFRYLQPAQIEAVCNGYIREVEAAIVREHMDALAKQVVGGDLISVQHAESLLQALAAERERLKALIVSEET